MNNLATNFKYVEKANPVADPYARTLLKTLVVDDSLPARQYLGIMLEEANESAINLDISYAASGKEAIKLIDQEDFQLVFLDIVMPEMDGYEVCKNIKNAESKARIIMLTGNINEMDRNRGLEVGCNHYIGKPIQKEFLTDIISMTVRKYLNGDM